MRYNSITYLISEGFKNVLKNKKASITSLITMICAMFLFGAFFIIGENINEILVQVQEDQGIQVFIKDEATDEQVQQLKDNITSLEGINTIKFVTKQEALDSMKETYKDHPEIFERYEGENNNIFPDSYVITFTDLSLANDIQAKISQMENVKKITSKNEVIETLMNLAKGINIAIGVVFLLLLVFAITIITNTIRLTVLARRKEISIMKYVGATNSFIRWPFMVEGILIGVVSASITISVLAFAYNKISLKVEATPVFSNLGVSLLQFSDMAQIIIIVFLILGIGIGVIGSRISMKKYLEV